MIPYRYLAAVRAANSSSEVHDEQGSGEPLTTAQQSTMSRLRHAALTVFEEQGFAATTADKVSQRAGVSRRTFFRYFPTKEDALFCDHAVHLSRVDDLLDPADPDR